MTWTTSADLRARVQRWWNRGELLAILAGAPGDFPRRLPLKGPSSSELSEKFGPAREWVAQLEADAKHYRLVWRTVNHRTLGTNTVPTEVWIDSLEDALEVIGKRRDAARFAGIVADIRGRHPEALPWLVKKPLSALAVANDWPLLLSIVTWIRRHPRPDVYLRQVPIPGVHSKFIESHRSTLAALLDRVLPPSAIDARATGAAGFCRRYGFRDKPPRVRFRLLDPGLAVLPTGTDQDISLTGDTFARLDLPVRRVFVTENEINFLAFPNTAESMVIFGAGYGFEMMSGAAWLHDRQMYYWGDIDTHGFAILDQLRSHFPQAQSFLMDRDTLLAHRKLWETEPSPLTRPLPRLTPSETALYQDLRSNRLGDHIRLEQERIGYDWLTKNL